MSIGPFNRDSRGQRNRYMIATDITPRTENDPKSHNETANGHFEMDYSLSFLY